jgi:hypothetical protein
MNPRLMVICLGGLAGAGAVVCCDLDEGLDEIQAAGDGEGAEGASAEPEADFIADGDAVAVH